jgi:hypothetical protein
MAVIGPAQMNFTLYRGSAPTLVFTMTNPPPGGVGGWTTKFTVRTSQRSANPFSLQKLGAVVDQVLGVFEVPLTEAETLLFKARPYAFSFVRVDPGNGDVLTIGTMTVRLDVLDAEMAA